MIKNIPKMMLQPAQKPTKNQPKIDPKSAQSLPKIGSGADFASEAVFGQILIPFWAQLGANLGAKLGRFWPHVDDKVTFLRFWTASRNDHDF